MIITWLIKCSFITNISKLYGTFKIQNRIKNGFKITMFPSLKLYSLATRNCISNQFLCKISRNRLTTPNLGNLLAAQLIKRKKRLSFSHLQFLLLRFQCLKITFKAILLQQQLILNTQQNKVFLSTKSPKFLTP